MHRILNHPVRAYVILSLLAVCTLLASGADGKAPADGRPRPHDAGYAIAGIAFFAFLLTALAMLALSATLLVRRRRRRTTAST